MLTTGLDSWLSAGRADGRREYYHIAGPTFAFSVFAAAEMSRYPNSERIPVTAIGAAAAFRSIRFISG
jgi:hypothetical protein